MVTRAIALLSLGALMTGCPFALDDDYFIDDAVVGQTSIVGPDAATLVSLTVPPMPAIPRDAGAPGDELESCPKKDPCQGDECQAKECAKMP